MYRLGGVFPNASEFFPIMTPLRRMFTLSLLGISESLTWLFLNLSDDVISVNLSPIVVFLTIDA